MAKRETASTARAEHPWKDTAVVIALITTVGGLIGTSISTFGGDGDAKDTAQAPPSTTHAPTTPPPMTPSPTAPPESTTQPQVQLSTTGTSNLQPPPRIAVDFAGTASGVRKEDAIVVVGTFLDGTPLPGRANTQSEHAMSPRATYNADGTWQVRWVLDKPPSIAKYKPVVLTDLAIPQIIEARGGGGSSTNYIELSPYPGASLTALLKAKLVETNSSPLGVRASGNEVTVLHGPDGASVINSPSP